MRRIRYWASLFKSDALALNISGPFTYIKMLITHAGFAAVFIYRIQAILTEMNLIPLAKIAHRTNISFNGFDASIGSEIGHSFRVSHPVGVIIGGKFKAGKNLTILAHAVIGQKSFSHSEAESQNPKLGDNINIGAGAIILGEIFIGSNSIVSAGALVTRDLPPNSIAYGNPVKIKRLPVENKNL